MSCNLKKIFQIPSGTTTRMNFLSTANNFRNKLPAISNLVALNLWDSVSIIFIYISLLEYIVADYLDRHPRKGTTLEGFHNGGDQNFFFAQ